MRLGRIGLWLQLVVGSVPVALLIYAILFDGGGDVGTRGQVSLLQYLTAGNMVVLAFTTIWSFRYTHFSHRIADPDRRPSASSIQRVAWIGVAASTLGIVFSVSLMLLDATQLLLYFLRAPQAGVPVIQTTGGAASWVSAGDMMSLMGLIVMMSVEVVILAFSLWLLFLTTVSFPDVHAAYEDRTSNEI